MIAVLFLLLCIPGSVRLSGISLEQNGYDDILIALPEDVQPSNYSDVISFIQKLFSSSSRVLYVATKRRSHFKSATVLLPPSWNTDANATWSGGGRLRRDYADVIISSYGTSPWALQHRGCGIRGRRMYLPGPFLRSQSSQLSWEQKGVPFVRAWAEFRYGVFPEGGFFEDSRYPPYIGVPGAPQSITVAACSDPFPSFVNKTESGVECEPEVDINTGAATNERCMPQPVFDEMERPSVSSITYQQMMSQAPMFCEGTLNLGPRHNPRGPSKQNLICQEQSTWHVILRSPDFANGRNAATKYEPSPFRLRFVRESSAPTIVLAMDVSASMREQSRYLSMKSAFSKFVSSDLPDGSRIAIVYFANSSHVSEEGFVELNNSDSRSLLLESDPLPQEPLDDDHACVECALEQAIELLEADPDNEGGIIVVLSSTTHLKVSSVHLSKRLSKIRLEAILFTSGDSDEVKKGSLHEICEETGGYLVSLQTADNTKPYLDFLYRAMAGLLHHHVLIAEEWLEASNPRLTFTLDDGIANDLKVTVGGPHFDTFDPPLVTSSTTLTDGNDTYSRFQRLDYVPAWQFVIPSPKAGDFVFETKWKERQLKNPVLVSVRSKPMSNRAITAKLWTEIVEIKLDPFAVLLFVEIRSGDWPVVGSKVEATIIYPNGSLSSTFDLLDDGNTTPDITHGDGVYSRTFTKLNATGFYNVMVTVTGNEDTFILKGPSSDCCGSIFPHGDLMPSGTFKRLLGPHTFPVLFPAGEKDEHHPSRVTDLSVHRTFSRTFVLTWSAAGGDHELGYASQYELKISSDRTQLRMRFDAQHPGTSPLTTIELPERVSYGTRLFHTYQVPDDIDRGTHFFAIRAVDEAGNTGEVSNTIEVWIEQGNEKGDIACDVEEEPRQERYNSASVIFLASTFVTLLLVFHLILGIIE